MITRSEQNFGGVHLEIGCGSTGRDSLQAGSVAIGMDLDMHSLHDARQVSSGWTFICADARSIPLRNDSCTSVMLQAVLHHLAPIDAALFEFTRVLASSGTLTIADGVALDPQAAALLDAELGAAGLPAEPIYGFDLDELADLIRNAGLKVEELGCDGTTTFATPPFVSKPYTTGRFQLVARLP